MGRRLHLTRDMGQDRIRQVIGHSMFWIVLSGILMFTIGYITSSVFPPGMEYKNEISLADIINIAATAIVTLSAAWYITKKLNEARYAKELAIDDLKEIEDNIASIVRTAQTPIEAGTHPDILPSIHQLHGLLKRLEHTCQINGKSVPVENIMNRFYCFYGCATNFGDESFNSSLIITTGDDLIVAVRETMLRINKL